MEDYNIIERSKILYNIFEEYYLIYTKVDDILIRLQRYRGCFLTRSWSKTNFYDLKIGAKNLFLQRAYETQCFVFLEKRKQVTRTCKNKKEFESQINIEFHNGRKDGTAKMKKELLRKISKFNFTKKELKTCLPLIIDKKIEWQPFRAIGDSYSIKEIASHFIYEYYYMSFRKNKFARNLLESEIIQTHNNDLDIKTILDKIIEDPENINNIIDKIKKASKEDK